MLVRLQQRNQRLVERERQRKQRLQALMHEQPDERTWDLLSIVDKEIPEYSEEETQQQASDLQAPMYRVAGTLSRDLEDLKAQLQVLGTRVLTTLDGVQRNTEMMRESLTELQLI
jgi:hypothetical protein